MARCTFFRPTEEAVAINWPFRVDTRVDGPTQFCRIPMPWTVRGIALEHKQSLISALDTGLWLIDC